MTEEEIQKMIDESIKKLRVGVKVSGHGDSTPTVCVDITYDEDLVSSGWD